MAFSEGETVNEVLYVFNECEMARFTPSQSDNAMHELYDKASAAIKSIEDEKPQKKAIEEMKTKLLIIICSLIASFVPSMATNYAQMADSAYNKESYTRAIELL